MARHGAVAGALGAAPMKYPDRIVVTRPDPRPGTQDPVSGQWVGHPDVVVYDGPARVQAGGLLVANRRSVSSVEAEADGRAILPPRAREQLMDMVPKDNVQVLYAHLRSGDTELQYGADAEVTFVRPEDRNVLLRYR